MYLKALNHRLLGTEAGCERTQKLMSAFIDSMATAEETVLVETHVATCSPCQRQMQALVSVRNLLLCADEPATPPDLVLETRVKLSHERSRGSLRRLATRLDNALRPLAVPAGAGVTVTLLFFFALLGNFHVPQNLAPAYDPPTQSYQRARADAPTAWTLGTSSLSLPEPLLIEAVVDLRGRVVNYEILSGSSRPELDRWLKETLYYAEFKPARVFGEPVLSHVILSFVGITVV